MNSCCMWKQTLAGYLEIEPGLIPLEGGGGGGRDRQGRRGRVGGEGVAEREGRREEREGRENIYSPTVPMAVCEHVPICL